MDATDAIRRLHQHRLWVNARLLVAARTLDAAQLRQPFDIGRGSLFATLAHLYGSEYAWLEALRGNAEPHLADEHDFDSLEELQIAWAALDRRWARFLDELKVGMLDREVVKVSTSSGAGRAHRTPAVDVLLHVCTHAQYTAAQAANMLRRLGVSPDRIPDTMLITMSREENR